MEGEKESENEDDEELDDMAELSKRETHDYSSESSSYDEDEEIDENGGDEMIENIEKKVVIENEDMDNNKEMVK